MSSAALLLVELARRGVHIEVRGDQLRYRPHGAVAHALRAKLTANKKELIELLRGGREFLGVPMKGTDNTDRSSLLAVLSVPPDSVARNATVPVGPATGCYCCLGREFFRVARGPEWVCVRCHPPLPGAVIVERWHAPQPSIRDRHAGLADGTGRDIGEEARNA